MTVASVVATPPLVVRSPVKSAFVIAVAPENFERFPLAGLPVVVTVPVPPVTAEMTPPEIVMDVPSGFTTPRTLVVAVGAEMTPPETARLVPTSTIPSAPVVATGKPVYEPALNAPLKFAAAPVRVPVVVGDPASIIEPVPVVPFVKSDAANVCDPPSAMMCPATVRLLFVNDPLPILVKVLDEPLMVLFVNVSVVPAPRMLSVALRSVHVPDAALEEIKDTEPEPTPASFNAPAVVPPKPIVSDPAV